MPGTDVKTNTIRIRQKNPSSFSKFRTKQITEGVQATIGIRDDGTSEVQSFVFDKTKFDVKKAKSWVKEHNGKIKEQFSVPYINLIPVKEDVVVQEPVVDDKQDDGIVIDETHFDIKHASNGKVDKEKVLKEIENLKKFQPHVEKNSYNKIYSFLKGKLKESFLESIRDLGYNTDNESTLTCDSFHIEPIKEQEDVSLKESSNATTVKRALVRLVRSGESKNSNVYSGSCLRKAAPLFEGIPIYHDHIEEEKGEKRSVSDKVGFYSNVEFIGTDNEGELRAVANILSTAPKSWDLIKEQFNHPGAKLCGFSISALGKGKAIKDSTTGKTKRIIEDIVKADSTDMVDNPSAGGKVLQLLESVRNEINSTSLGEDEMDLITLKEKHADLVKQIVDDAKSLALKEAEDAAKAAEEEKEKKMVTCPDCKKEFAMKESVDHVKAHLAETVVKLQEAEKEVATLKRDVSITKLKESITERLSKENLETATVKRLAESLLQLGTETREGDKPSNWDLRIQEEKDYVLQLKGDKKPLVTGSERTETKTETVKLSESEAKIIAAKIANSI